MNHLRNAVLTLAVTFALAARAESFDAREVYGRLLAPCCWTQTLDIHDSELATQLRVEIAARLARGEPALAIEDDMARRFGERVRAVPRASDPRQSMALAVISLMVATLTGLLLVARRWLRRQAARRGAHGDAHAALGADYDARLDRELRRAE